MRGQAELEGSAELAARDIALEKGETDDSQRGSAFGVGRRMKAKREWQQEQQLARREKRREGWKRGGIGDKE